MANGMPVAVFPAKSAPAPVKLFSLFLCTLFERERDFSVHWFTPPMVMMASTELILSQESRAYSRYPVWTEGLKDLSLPLVLSQAVSRELDPEMELPGFRVPPMRD